MFNMVMQIQFSFFNAVRNEIVGKVQPLNFQFNQENYPDTLFHLITDFIQFLKLQPVMLCDGCMGSSVANGTRM